VNSMASELAKLPGVSVLTQVPRAEAREPYIEIEWDERYEISPGGVKQLLRDGTPSIEVRALFLSGGKLHLTGSMMEEYQAPLVVNRIKEILNESAGSPLSRRERT